MDMSEEDGHPRDASGLRSAPPSLPATERDLEPVRVPDETGSERAIDAARAEHDWFHDAESTTRPRPPSRAPSASERPPQGARLPELPPHLQVRKVLGQGGTAVVYEALHTRLNVRVAVKVLAAADPHEAEARSRLLREAELYARLSDPRFPRVYDVDELPDGTPFVVMEFIEGRTLAEALMFGPMEIDAVYYVAREILEALTEIHQVGIVHRDIKPSNILLEGDWGDDVGVRLVDFGIAKSVLSEPTAHPLTQQGTMLGTPHYMAPEQITAQPLDERVDIYAVGVVLYELLTGQMPFDGPTVGEVIAAALRDTPRPLSSLRPDVPRGLESVIMRAMAREREDRFPSAHEMLCALHAARVEDQGLLPLPSSDENAEAKARVEEPRALTIVPEDDEHELAGEEEAEPLLLSKPAHEEAPLAQSEQESEGDDTLVEGDSETLAMLGNLRAPAKKRDFAWYAARAAALLAMIGLMAWPAELFDVGDAMPSSERVHAPEAATAPPASAPSATPEPRLATPSTDLVSPSLAPAATPAQVTPLPEPLEISDDQLTADGETELVAGKSAPEQAASDRRPKREKRRTDKPTVRQTVRPQAPAAPPAPAAPAKDIAPVEPRPLELTPNLETRRPPAPRRQLDALPANPY